MANEIELINGVTKRLKNDTGEYYYEFPEALVIVDTVADTISFQTTKNYADRQTAPFSQLTNNFGTANAEEYADYLAANSFFFNPSESVPIIVEEVLTPVDVVFPYAQTDKSGALHTESVLTQIDLKHTKDKLPLFFDEVINGTASSTFDQTKAGVVMDVLADGDYVIRQTKVRFNYLTGKTKVITETAHDMGIEADVIKRFGYFNGGTVAPYVTFDGIYIEMDGTDYNLCVAKNGVVDSIPRSSWTDKLDGTGASGITVDFSNFLIIRVQFLWLGGGPVTFFIETNDNLYEIYTFKHGNALSEIYMESPNQPVRYEIRSTGGAGSFVQVCSTVGSYGGNDLLGQEHGAKGFSNVSIPAAGVDYLIYAIRLKDTHTDLTVSILDFRLLVTTNDDYIYSVLLNPTISGTLTWVDESNSGVQIAIGNGSQTITAEGFNMSSGLGTRQTVISTSTKNVLRLGSNINGDRDVIAFAVTPISNNMNGYATTNWLENN